MPEREDNNVLDRLKSKEDEMEALIAEARRSAAAIREEAAARAKRIIEDAAVALEPELEEMTEKARSEVAREVRSMEDRSRREAEELRKRGAAKKAEAVEAVVRFVMEGVCDQGDEEGPDNRAEG
ncbi:MAG: hypothetical protein ACE5EI_06870 [Thermodesulfobacteriota bacterium]